MAEHEDPRPQCDHDHKLLLQPLLESLRTSSLDVQSKYIYLPLDPNSPAIKSLLEIESYSTTVLSQFPDLLNLTTLLAHFKTLIDKLKSYQSYSLSSFVYRRLFEYQIYCAAVSIEGEIRGWFDRDIVRCLVEVFQGSEDGNCGGDDEGKVTALVRLERRVSVGFDKELQDLMIREKVFNVLESALCDDSCSPSVRENSALAIAALAGFNKNVFGGLVLMGSSVRALVRMGTAGSLHVLALLIRLIKGHLVDEMDLNGEIPIILSKLSSENSCVQTMAMECVLEMGYFGRKDVIDEMLEFGLIEKLVYLQRLDLVDEGNEEDGNSVNVGDLDEDEDEETDDERRLSSHPFSGSILRFAVQVEVGEGLDKFEKKAIKMEILKRAREACVSEAEAAAIAAEVLWGSSP